jgi:hypothetical protein
MTDRFSIGQFTVDENDTAPNQPRWTLTTGQFSTGRQGDGNWSTNQEEKIESPRFAFLKISSCTHCTHLQSRTSHPAGQALQKSAILPALKKLITIYG